MSAPAAAHSVETSEWFTPRDIVAASRAFLGGIDLDPASCEAAQAIVGAQTFFTTADDGLSQAWVGRVFCNPPSPPRPWGEWLAAGVACGLVTRAIFVGYSIETLSQSQGWRGWRLGEPGAPSIVCVPAKRPRYLRPDGTPGASPAHASAIFGFGPVADFAVAFAPLGACYWPARYEAPCG